MTSTPGSVITVGYGAWGSPGLVITLGLGTGSAPPVVVTGTDRQFLLNVGRMMNT